ncbi:MAG: 2-phospho-L-lactate guanylyltransferase [Thermoleophilia bacterium]|nr:2-phospho-L-lactate guanylyltransferase [Thermoleophilia bacterium]
MRGHAAAIIPVKPLETSLGRLADVLDGPRRRALQAAMLADVLGACTHASRLAATYLVTADPGAAVIAGTFGARLVDDHSPPQGINPAVERGQSQAIADGYRSALVMTADLPQITPTAIDGVIEAGGGFDATLVPSESGTGTNAMLLRPPDVLRPEFGSGSLARHIAQASAARIRHQILEVGNLAIDVDTPEDLLEAIRSGAVGMEFARACRVLRIDASLPEACPS